MCILRAVFELCFSKLKEVLWFEYLALKVVEANPTYVSGWVRLGGQRVDHHLG